jgi:orotidine-5'-phosphate decarboxylase
MTPSARDRLFVALDLPEITTAERLVDRLGDTVSAYKIGLELVFAGGLSLAERLRDAGKIVFLDMKLLDIPNTVEKAAANVAALGLDYLTVHATDGKTLAAAARGRGDRPLKLLGVTVLTSLGEADLREQGIVAESPAELVLRRARLVLAAGCDGIVASGQEAAAIARSVPPGTAIVTPGIRLAEGADGDQLRVTTPAMAIAAGATHLVVGRPITAAAEPAAAARRFLAEIERATTARG